MSAQLSHHVTTRLLVVEKSENAAHELDSVLRNAGIATKLMISDDLAHVATIIDTVDVVLLTTKVDGIDNLLPRIRESGPGTPIILITDSAATDNPWSITRALELGATDVVPADQHEQLTLVVKRELEHVCQREHFSQVRRALKEAEERCQLLLQGSKAAIAYIHEGMHIHANEGYLNLFGYGDVEDLCGVSLVDILSGESATALKAQLKMLRAGADETVFDFTALAQSGEDVKGAMTLANSQYEGESCLQITVRKANEPTTAAPANPTPMVANDVLDSELALPGFVKAAETLCASASGESYILLAVLDHFKELKGAYGLLGAENVSRKVWLQFSQLAADFPVSKLSHQQYVIAVNGQNASEVAEIAENLRMNIGELILESQDKTVRPTLSIAGKEIENGDVNAALDGAYDLWLDLAERDGSNIVHIPQPDAHTAEEWDDARIILKQITEAIEKKMFVLLFQPIISLRGDSDEHYEVFLRMLNDSGEQIEPSRFLQTAIDNNVAGKIDRWVILQSIKMLSVHRAKGHATRLTINLTSNSVMDPEFLQWLTVAIKAARLPSDAVVFQITEKDAVTYLRQTREFVEGLRAMHLRASLSRFGLIDNSFETLHHIPVDMVKLDGEAVRNMDEQESDGDEIIATIKKLQQNGKLTIVPMVENANVLSTLWQAGANYIQGHYLQEPSTDMDYDFSTEE